MKKWEYAHLMWEVHEEGFDCELLYFDNTSGRIMPRNFTELLKGKSPFQILEVLNILGREGWEIIKIEEKETGIEWQVTIGDVFSTKHHGVSNEEWEKEKKRPFDTAKGSSGTYLLKRSL